MDDIDDLHRFASEEFVDDSTKSSTSSAASAMWIPSGSIIWWLQTFVKRLDVKVYRSDAGLSEDVPADTIRMFSTSAYFRPTEGIIRPPAPPPPPPMPPPPRVTPPRPRRDLSPHAKSRPCGRPSRAPADTETRFGRLLTWEPFLTSSCRLCSAAYCC